MYYNVNVEETIEYKIAKIVNEKGGRTYYVGGCVRDLFLGKENKDIDIEIHGIDESTLIEILSKFGEPLTYGKSFGIYTINGYNIDIALPRKEKKIGSGHKDFDVEINPHIDINDAIKRRDFTINAIYKDVLSGEIIDPFDGLNDINNKIIKHIDDVSFVEDPLRVLRAAQFASRFEFDVSNKTIELCKSIDIKTLSRERVEEELKKALLKSNKPSIFFKYLKDMNQIDYWFNDINLKYIDKANEYIDKVENKYAYLLSSLCLNSSFEIIRFTNDKQIFEYTENMRNNINISLDSDFQINKLFYRLININDFIYLKMSIDDKYNYLFEKYEAYKKLIEKPYVTGDDLIKCGFIPNKDFGEIIEFVTNLRLQGLAKDEALKLTKEFFMND